MEDTCCWHLGCHYCCREPQGGPSPCPVQPAVPLSSAPSSRNWVLQRLQWDCPLLGIVVKLTDPFPLTCQQSNYGGQTHRLWFCFLCLLVKIGAAHDWIFVEVAIGEVIDCKRIEFTTMQTKNKQFAWIQSLKGRHWVIVSYNWASVDTTDKTGHSDFTCFPVNEFNLFQLESYFCSFGHQSERS